MLDDYKLRDARVQCLFWRIAKSPIMAQTLPFLFWHDFRRASEDGKGHGACVLLYGRIKGQTQVSCIREVDGEVPLSEPVVSLGYSDDDVVKYSGRARQGVLYPKALGMYGRAFSVGRKAQRGKTLDFLEEAEKIWPKRPYKRRRSH